MGCNADECGASPAQRDNSKCFVCGGSRIFSHSDRDCIMSMAERLTVIESKLGAAPVIGSKAQASEATARRQEAGAAPSISAFEWRARAMFCASLSDHDTARACDLAAAVTEWGTSPEVSPARIMNICIAFVRGEPLPQRGG